jgi:hypothetical protein
MALQLFKIETVDVASPVSSVTFSNIPQTYSDLKLVASVRSNRAAAEDGFGITVNSASSGYTYRVLSSTGTAASTSATAFEQIWVARVNGNTTTANAFAHVDAYFPNYTSSNAKTYSVDGATESNTVEGYITFSTVAQSSTSAITSLTVQTINGTVGTNSSFTLYGVL